MSKRFEFNIFGLFTTDSMATVNFCSELFEQMVSRTFNYPAGLNGTMELSFNVPSFSDVDKEYANALSYGAKPLLAPTTEPWGQRTILMEI